MAYAHLERGKITYIFPYREIILTFFSFFMDKWVTLHKRIASRKGKL